MHSRARLFGCLLGILLALPTISVAAPTLRISRQAFGGGSVQVSSGSFAMRGTISSTPIGRISGATFEHGIGFWYTLPQPIVTAVDDAAPGQIIPYRLDQNSPNPFNPRTTIRFALSDPGPVKLKVFDLRGRRVATLIDQEMVAGEHELVFHATHLASGVYVYRIQAGQFTQSRLITLIK